MLQLYVAGAGKLGVCQWQTLASIVIAPTTRVDIYAFLSTFPQPWFRSWLPHP